MNKNSKKPRVGKEFQITVKAGLKKYDSTFELVHIILIGKPPKIAKR